MSFTPACPMMRRFCVLLGLLALSLSAVSSHGRDAFVVISGGGDPAGNNYSQYLQARAVPSRVSSPT